MLLSRAGAHQCCWFDVTYAAPATGNETAEATVVDGVGLVAGKGIFCFFPWPSSFALFPFFPPPISKSSSEAFSRERGTDEL